MRNRLDYIEELNGVCLIILVVAYHFNNTLMATIAMLIVLVGLLVNVYHCFVLKKIVDIQLKVGCLKRIINQSITSIGIVLLYYFVRW